MKTFIFRSTINLYEKFNMVYFKPYLLLLKKFTKIHKCANIAKKIKDKDLFD